jgi:amino acid adenylation domain-containing protein
LDLDAQAEAIAAMPTYAPARSVLPQNLAYITYTSGSTGRPKGVMTRHASASSYLNFLRRAYGMGPADRVLQVPSLSFDASVRDILGCLVAGGQLRLLSEAEARQAGALARYLREDGISAILSITPSFLETVVADESWQVARRTLPLRLVLVSGEVLDGRIVTSVHRVLGEQVRVVNQYGPTECTMTSTYRHCDTALTGTQGIGRPIDRAHVYVLDTMLEPVPVGVSGELYIGGAGVSRGYAGRPDLTAERFLPDPFGAPGEQMYRTGDRVRWTAGGQLQYLGRLDDQVKIRGFRVEPGEIQAVLRSLPALRDATVIVRQAGDELQLVAYAVPVELAQNLDAASLRDALRPLLPDYMLPRHIVLLDRLPLTANGKLDRSALPPPDPDQDAQAYVAPRTPVEQALADIWSDILGLERIGANDDFFERGGQSLRATRVISRIRSSLDVELPLRAMFESPRLSELATRIEAMRQISGEAMAAISPISRTEAMPLSFAQQRLWFLDQFEGQSAFYNMPAAIRLRGELDTEALRLTLQAIVERHEVLRSRFIIEKGAPAQVIGVAMRIELPIDDLSSLPVDQRETRAREHARVEASTAFDLAKDVLLRARLLTLADDDHIALLTLHHIVSDGWSMGVLVNEVAALYAAFVEAKPSPLPPLPLQYADYAHWQRQWLQGEVLARQRDYWKRQLADAPALLSLPTDRPRPAVQRHVGSTVEVTLDAAATTALHALARQSQATLFMVLTAAFNVLLSRHAGQDDVCIGTPVANRPRSELEALIGFFVNTLVLRTRLDGNPRFDALLAQVRETALAAYAHQDLPFEQVVEDLKPPRHLGHAPLFQVMLILQNTPASSLELPGLRLEALPEETPAAKFDLTATVVEQGEGLRIRLGYNTDLFDDSSMAQLAARFVRLLHSVAQAPTQRIGAIALLAANERAQLLALGQGEPVEHDPRVTLPALFEAQAARAPEVIALCFGDQVPRYGELETQANQLAHALIARGIGAEDRVALCLERSPAMVVALLAVLKAGAAYVPLDPAYPRERLTYMLGDAKPALLLSTQALESLLPPGGERLDLDAQAEAIAAMPTYAPARSVLPQQLAYVIYTSGSTGRPKGVCISHGALDNFIHAFQSLLKLDPADRLLAVTSLSFDIAALELFLPLTCGARVVLASREEAADPAGLAALLTRHEVSLMQATPSTWRMLVDHGWPETRQPLRALCGGAAMPSALAQQLLSRVDALWNVYGPTETTIWSSAHRVDAMAAPIPVGRAIAQTRLHVLDAALEPVPIGVVGELYIAGTGLARGYLGRPEQTAERFLPDPFAATGERMYRTGDLVRLLANGDIEYLGRADDQVKIRGFRIELGEIEAVLGELPSVSEVAVLVREIAGDLSLVAYVTAVSTALDAATLQAALRARLPAHMVPAHIVLLERMPQTPNGKLNRHALPMPVSTGSITYVPPHTATERSLAAIWQEVLCCQRVGLHDDFFELGGHSLLAVTLMAGIKQRLGVSLPLSQLFLTSSMGALATAIDQQSLRREVIVPLRSSECEAPPLFLFHPAGGEVFCYAALIDALDPDLSIYGVQSARRAGLADSEDSFDEACERYAELIEQTCAGGPCQLAGWSLGGKLAFQVAVLLERRGIIVVSLTLFDTIVARQDVIERGETLADFLAMLAQTDKEQIEHLFGIEALELHARLLRLVQAQGMNNLAGMLQREDAALEKHWNFRPSDQHALLRMHERMVLSDRVASQFAPQPLAAPIHSFWAEDTLAQGYEAHAWAPHTQAGGDVIVLPGNHMNFILGDNARRIAQLLGLLSQPGPSPICENDKSHA